MRPAFHFTPARHWMNDPNGLVWHDGEYHLFFQHNPLGPDWGNMSWGHAVSADLWRWTELPVALEHGPDEYVYSGSVVIDHDDTSGLGDGEPAMVALHTSHQLSTRRESQCLAWSLDRGRTWRRHPGNPVLDLGGADFRDPKVLRHGEGWVMAVSLAAARVVRLYGSTDLLSWHHLSDVGAIGATDHVWECPDLFPLPVDGEPGETRWVLVVSVLGGGPAGGSAVQYVVGDFDGVTFTPEHPSDEPRWADHGSDFYAAVSFDGAPGGRRLLVGWMSDWRYAREVPTSPWRGAMTIVRAWSLRRVDGRLELVQTPVLGGLPDPAYAVPELSLTGSRTLPVRATSFVLSATLDPGTAGRCGLVVRAGGGEQTLVGYDAATGEVFVDRTVSGATGFHPDFAAVHRAPLLAGPGGVGLEVLVDATSVEVFADGGRVVVTDQIFPSPTSDQIAAFAEDGSATVRDLTVRVVGP